MTVKNSEGRNQHSSKEVCAQNGPNPRTAEIVAKEHGIGRNTVKRAAKFSKGVDAAEKIERRFDYRHSEGEYMCAINTQNVTQSVWRY